MVTRGRTRRLAVCALAAVVVCGVGAPVAMEALGQEAAGEKRFECLGIGGGGQMYGVGISPHDKNLMHLSCDMGNFYQSADGGRAWRMIDQLQMNGTGNSCRPAYHPTDPNVVYQVYHGGYGTWSFRVSRDRGRTWEILCDGWPAKQPEGRDKFDHVTAINIDPADARLIFVATGEGLWRSTDGGRNFARCEGVEGGAVWTYVQPPRGGGGPLTFAGTTTGLYVSTDRGATWTRRGRDLPEGMFGMGAATDPEGVVHLYTCHKGAVCLSHDGGETFTRAEGLPEQFFRFITVSEKAPRTVYVSTFEGDFGVYKTVDGGRTWEQVLGPYGEPGSRVHWGWIGIEMGKGWGGRANCITVAPDDPDTVAYVNTGELFITRDGGRTWQEHASKYHGPDPNNIQKGQSWGSVGLEVALPGSVLFDPFVKDRWYLTYGDICFLVSTDGGRSWRRSVEGIPKGWTNSTYRVVADPDRKGVLYAACSGAHDTLASAQHRHGGPVISTDHGETWKPIADGLKTESSFATDIVIDPRSPVDRRTLYCVMFDDGLYKSTDGGRSWTRKMTGLGKPGNDKVYSVRLLDDGTLYAMVTANRVGWKFPNPGGGLYRSTDAGESWVDITKGMDLAFPRCFAVDPFDKTHIYLATSQGSGREGAGLWETTDGGGTWTRVLSSEKLNELAGRMLYPFLHSNGLTFHPKRKGWVYYATGTHGLWLTKDGGKTWKQFVGIPRLTVSKIFFDPKDADIIYAGSVGLWRGPAQGY